MAETNSTAAVKATSVQAKKNSNLISWVAPVVCIIAGYLIWRFIMGDPSGFKEPDPNGGFWPPPDSTSVSLCSFPITSCRGL